MSFVAADRMLRAIGSWSVAMFDWRSDIATSSPSMNSFSIFSVMTCSLIVREASDGMMTAV